MATNTEEWLPAVVDLADDSTTVLNGPAVLGLVYVNTALSAHVCLIKDDTTSIFTLPASTAAGAFFDFEGTRFETSLVVDPDNSATGSITVLYKKLR